MKTNLSFCAASHRAARAFTLVELLVVVTIISVLAALVASQVGKSLVLTYNHQTKVQMMELKSGLENYHLDYQCYPLDQVATSGDDDAEVLTDGSNRVVDTLLGLPSPGRDLNPRHEAYATLRPAKNDRYGIVGTYIPRRVNDTWGRPYRILLDTNGDNQVKNPAAASADPRVSHNQPSHLAMQVALYSLGKDGLPATQDDVSTWR